MKKNELRKRAKDILSKVSSSDFDNWNISLSENLRKFLSEENVISKIEVVGGFAPILHEPMWMSGAKGFSLAFPSFEEKMIFKLSRFEDLEKTFDFKVEILGPKKNSKEVTPSLLLIPGLGFTHKGERLGRGKGFYDRYLEDFKGPKVGLCFECQLLDETELETEPHDQKVNFIVTEKNIYKIRS